MPDHVHELLATETALDKLGTRHISAEEAEQTLHNSHATAPNPHQHTDAESRRLLVGRTDGGRTLTLVIERTVEPTTWLIVTGWESTEVERRILGS